MSLLATSAVVVFVLALGASPVFAVNTLENTELRADESAVIDVNIKFGMDEIRTGVARDWTSPTLESAKLIFGADELDISNSQVNVYAGGKLFKIYYSDKNILMYGKYDKNLEKYKISINFIEQSEFTKYTVYAEARQPEENTVEIEEKEPVTTAAPQIDEERYVPKLSIVSNHDFRTYWLDTFDVYVNAYDSNKNPRPDRHPFEGRQDGAEVTVLISKDGKQLTELSGTTKNNGYWAGSYHVEQNVVPGEYVVDLIVTYLNQSISKTTSMFIIGDVGDSDGSSSRPLDSDGDGIPNTSDLCPSEREDGFDDPTTPTFDESVDGCEL